MTTDAMYFLIKGFARHVREKQTTLEAADVMVFLLALGRGVATRADMEQMDALLEGTVGDVTAMYDQVKGNRAAGTEIGPDELGAMIEAAMRRAVEDIDAARAQRAESGATA